MVAAEEADERVAEKRQEGKRMMAEGSERCREMDRIDNVTQSWMLFIHSS